jgi:hypothetical protein
MSIRLTHVPSYRLKRSGKRKVAVVSLPDGKGARHDVLLGKYGSKKSRAEYARVLADWEEADRTVSRPESDTGLTVNEWLAKFWNHAQIHYRHAGVTLTAEISDLRHTIQPLREMYGHTPAARCRPLCLEAIRQRLIYTPIAAKAKTTDLAQMRANCSPTSRHGCWASIVTIGD